MQSGSVEIAVGRWSTACYRIGAVICSLPRASLRAAIVAIDADMKQLVRASNACRRLMTIPGVGQFTALAFTAAIDDAERFRRSRDVGPYLGLVPRRYQSGEVDYIGSISKCGDRRCARCCTKPPMSC